MNLLPHSMSQFLLGSVPIHSLPWLVDLVFLQRRSCFAIKLWFTWKYQNTRNIWKCQNPRNIGKYQNTRNIGNTIFMVNKLEVVNTDILN